MLCHGGHTPTHSLEEAGWDREVTKRDTHEPSARISNNALPTSTGNSFNVGIHPRTLALSINIITAKGRFLTNVDFIYPRRRTSETSAGAEVVRRSRLRSRHPLAEETPDWSVCVDCLRRSIAARRCGISGAACPRPVAHCPLRGMSNRGVISSSAGTRRAADDRRGSGTSKAGSQRRGGRPSRQ